MAECSSTNVIVMEDMYNILDDDFSNILEVLTEEEEENSSSNSICENVSLFFFNDVFLRLHFLSFSKLRSEYIMYICKQTYHFYKCFLIYAVVLVM